MKYMIHACQSRLWYVTEYLIPSMKEQGIEPEEIETWLDTEGKGNLISCMDSFRTCNGNGTWHLQDDVVICSDFAARTKEHDDGIVCGYAYQKDVNRLGPRIGYVAPEDMWWSFPCIRIPDEIAFECAEWFYNWAYRRNEYHEYISAGKYDDYLFLEFLKLRHGDIQVLNLAPNLVDHIDYLIGGSAINRDRGTVLSRTAFWKEPWIVDDLERKLNER